MFSGTSLDWIQNEISVRDGSAYIPQTPPIGDSTGSPSQNTPSHWQSHMIRPGKHPFMSMKLLARLSAAQVFPRERLYSASESTGSIGRRNPCKNAYNRSDVHLTLTSSQSSRRALHRFVSNRSLLVSNICSTYLTSQSSSTIHRQSFSLVALKRFEKGKSTFLLQTVGEKACSISRALDLFSIKLGCARCGLGASSGLGALGRRSSTSPCGRGGSSASRGGVDT